MRRVLILGGGGLLGRALERHRPDGVESICPAHGELPLEAIPSLHHRLDTKPVDRIVLLAAWTRVDDCEADPDRAFRQNGILPGRIAGMAEQRGVPIVFVSTDYVFDGLADRPYREYDPARPCSVYGRSKWHGECAVRAASQHARIVRTSGLFGAGGGDFVSAIQTRLEKTKGDVPVVTDQVLGPSWVDHVAPALWTITLGDEDGVFHVSNGGEASWFEFARQVAIELGADAERVVRTTSIALARPAVRPAYSVLDNQAALETFGIRLPSWRQGLAAHLRGQADGSRS